MNIAVIILNILLLIFSIKECLVSTRLNTAPESKDSFYTSKFTDTIAPQNTNFYLLLRGNKDYDIVLTIIQKEDYEAAMQLSANGLIEDTVIPSQVSLTESCYTVKTAVENLGNCLENDEELISIFYVGYVSKLNSCIVLENWFESTTSNLLINLEDGSISYISGYELVFSPNLKFIYSYANDGVDFSGISLHQMVDKKAEPILITDYEVEENYNFDFSSFGKAYWVSDSTFFAGNDERYYKFQIQDKRITYQNEFEENIINSENEKFTIKVDKLKNGTLRYMSWNKPNTTNDQPSLVLYGGEVEQQNKYGSGFDYRFENGAYLYIIENNIETTSNKRLMLRLYKDNEEKLYTSLRDLTKLKGRQ